MRRIEDRMPNKARRKSTIAGRRLVGRPAGKKLLHEDKKRFEIALTAAAKQMGLDNARATDIAILLASDRPLELKLVSDSYAMISAEKAGLEDRREYLAATIRKCFEDRTPSVEESEWFSRSVFHLEQLVRYSKGGEKFNESMGQLRDLGWAPTLSSIALRLISLPVNPEMANQKEKAQFERAMPPTGGRTNSINLS